MRSGSDPSRLRMIRIRACYRLICNHPFLVVMVVIMMYLRLSFPFMFFLLISASPIIICTAFLLGGLLALGQKQAKESQNDVQKSHKFSPSRPNCTIQMNAMISPRKGGGGDGGGGCFRDKFAEVRNDIVEKEMKEPRLRNIDGKDNSKDDEIKGSKGNNNVDHLMFVYNEKFPKTELKKLIDEPPRREEKGDDMDHSSSLSPSSSSSVYEGETDMPLESSKNYVPTLCDYHPLVEFEDRHDQALHDEPLKANERAMEFKGVKEEKEVSSTILEDHQEIHELSSSDNEHKEHLEELIQERNHDYDIDVHDDDEEEEDEHNESEEDDEDEDDDEHEDHNVEQGGIKAMVTWTEEDENNLKDLSRLELERNRQLERIMSRRIAQKTYSTITEKSVMDLDTSDLPFTVAPVSTTKNNPFDFAYSINNQPETPLVPASAPAFFPRRNPFDDLDDLHQNKPIVHNATTTNHVLMNVPIPDHHQNKSGHGHLEKDSMFLNKHQSFNTRHHEEREDDVPQDSTEASKREALFRRYQSFGVVGSSFYGFLWQENDDHDESSSLFNPYFASHKAHHSDNINGTDSSQGSTSGQASSSSSDVVEDQEDEEGSESSSEINMKEKEVSRFSEPEHSNVEDDAMKLEGDSSSHIEHVEPVYDSYETSPSAAGKNIFLSSESSDLQEGKSDM